MTDFIRQAYLLYGAGRPAELDLPQTVPPATGGFWRRFAQAGYSDWVNMQARMFPATVALARRMGSSTIPAAPFRARYDALQGVWVERCWLIAQNIRFALIALAVASGNETNFFWLTLLIPTPALFWILRGHERNAAILLAEISVPRSGSRALPEQRPLRGALLGLGGIARHGHLAALTRDPSLAASVEYVASFDPVSGTTPVPGIPLVHTLEDLEKLGPFDFVDICSPSSTHLPLARWALSRGWHVPLRKPVATSMAEATELGRLARAANRVVFPCHQYRYNPAWEWMRARLDEGAIGRWHLAEFQVWRLAADRGAAAGTSAPVACAT